MPDQHPHAYLVLGRGGVLVLRAYPPGAEHRERARKHAETVQGLLVGVPVLADYRPEKETDGA